MLLIGRRVAIWLILIIHAARGLSAAAVIEYPIGIGSPTPEKAGRNHC